MVRIKKTVTIDNSGATQDLLTLDKITTDELAIEVANSNSQDLAAFTIQVRFDEDGSWFTIASVAGDYTSPAGFMFAASGSLVTLTKNTSGWFVLKGIGSIQAIKLLGNSAGASSVLTITGKMR